MDWVPNMMSTVQMVGVLVGAGVAGQVGERIVTESFMGLFMG